MWAASLPRGLAVLTAGLLSVSLVAALVHSPLSSSDSQPRQPLAKARPREAVPLFGKTQPAANPTAIVVVPDECGLRGWIAGTKRFAGAKVTIKAGNERFSATIGGDNTFSWPHTSARALPVAVALATGGKTLTARTTLPARPTGTKRTAFIITDRSAYRPGHTLKFVAYVHETKDGIDFKPLANQDFTIDLTSETRQTRAAR